MSIGTQEKRKSGETGVFAPIARAVAEAKKAGWQRFYESVRTRASVYHINDCADDDAKLRLHARSSEVIGRNEAFAGASSDLEAAGLLIELFDGLDGASDAASRRHPNVALVNVAPRNGEAKQKHENGTPFGYFRYNGTTVVATVDGFTLSLVKKFGLVDSVIELDTKDTLERLREEGQINRDEQKRFGETQFRSYEFSPRVASFLLRKGELSGSIKSMDSVKDAPQAVWFVDAFGNLKTTVLPEEVLSEEVSALLKPAEGKVETGPVGLIPTAFGELPVYRRLKDVPDKTLAVIVGSSGLGDKRLLEIVVQGGSAAKALDAKVGTDIFAAPATSAESET